MAKTTWRKEITEALEGFGESWSDVVHTTLSDLQLDREFDDGYGVAEGDPFTLWTSRRVYFPATYDGMEWADSVPVAPCEEATQHIGGQ